MMRKFVSKARTRRQAAFRVEALEVRALRSSADIAWRMLPRLVPVADRGGAFDLPNTPSSVNPPGGYEVRLDASGSRGITRRSSFAWAVSGASGAPIVLRGESPTVSLPEGTYAVRLEADHLRGAAGPTFATQTIVVKDVLIVSMGDSYASGEGNPVVPGVGARRAPQWAYSPDPAMNLENANAHRSTLSGPAQFALALQKGDPHVAVTFVSVAASGASIAEGLLNPSASIGDPTLTLPSQVDEVRRIVGDRPIDELTVSAGGNDVGFATRLEQLATNTAAGFPSLGAIKAEVVAGFATLPSRFDALGAAIRGLDAAEVLVTEYPDLTRDGRGEVAPIRYQGSQLISRADASFALANILTPLDGAVQAAAMANGWTFVGGLSADFRTHGYSSPHSWIRSLGQSSRQEGSLDGAFHPNAAGHRDIAARTARRRLSRCPRPNRRQFLVVGRPCQNGIAT